jgi:hypothetical protein
MAGTLALNVEILGEFKKLTAATKGAEGNLAGLNKTASSISKGMITALGAIGVGFSLGAIKNEFEQASKAAIEDSKSMEILSLAMQNTGKATAGTVKEAEEHIKRMQIQSAVADDVLRPAFQKLFIATGDVTQSSKLLQVALDASAGTGKDLDSVTQAMAKSLAGQDTALLKLIPSLRGAQDPLAELEKTFKGAAEAAADTDPYQRINIIFGELQEQIGMALLPLLNDFSEWLATPKGQETLQAVVDGIVEIITELTAMAKWVIDNKDWLLPMVAAISGVTAAWNLATVAVNGFKTAAGIAAFVSGSAVATSAAVAAGAASGGFMQGQALGQQSQIYAGSGFQQGGGLFGNAFQQPATSFPSSSTPSQYTVNNYVTARTDATPKEIADAINRANKATGTNIIRGINTPR